MDRPKELLQELRQALDQVHRARIERSTYSSLVLRPHENGEFTALLTPRRGGEPFEKRFTEQYVFGPSMRFERQAWSREKRPCDYARLLIHDFLLFKGLI